MLDDEEIENNVSDIRLIKDLLGMNLEQYERYKASATKGLIKFGGNFAYHLGLLLQTADIANGVKILFTWYKECNEHDMLYRIFKAKEEAKLV